MLKTLLLAETFYLSLIDIIEANSNENEDAFCLSNRNSILLWGCTILYQLSFYLANIKTREMGIPISLIKTNLDVYDVYRTHNFGWVEIYFIFTFSTLLRLYTIYKENKYIFVSQSQEETFYKTLPSIRVTEIQRIFFCCCE